MAEWFGPKPGFTIFGKPINKNKIKEFEPSEEDKEFVLYLNNKYSGLNMVVRPGVYLYDLAGITMYVKGDIICKIIDIEDENCYSPHLFDRSAVQFKIFKIKLYNHYLGNTAVRSNIFYYHLYAETTLLKITDPYLVYAKKIDYLNDVIKYKLGIFKK